MYRKRIYFNLLHTPVHLLYGCTFLFLAAVIASWWHFAYQPLCAANHTLEQHLHLSFARLQSQKKSEKMAREVSKQFSDIKANMALGSKKDAALCSLVSLAQKNGLMVMNARLGRQANKPWCTMQELHAECRGTYDQLISFFDQLANQKSVITCKSCDIARVDKDTLTARVLFHTYVVK